MATGVNVGNAYINVRADSKYLKGDMTKAQTAFKTSFKRIALAATAAATAATYALSKIGKEAISVATKYETALVDMGKVTNQSFDVIKKAVESIDPVLGTSTELMKGYYQVISAGVTEPKEALELLTTASKLAKTAHVDQAEAIKGLTKIMAGYGDELKTTSDAADLLFAIEKEGQTSVAELIPLIGGLATISKEAGVTANEMGAALATLSKVFGSTSEAATSYQGILAALQRGNADLTVAWEKLGISGSKAAIKAWGFAGTLLKLKEYSESSGVEMIKLIGRVEATTGALVIAADGAKAFNTTMVNLQDRAGKAEEAFQRWTKTTEAFIQVWKSVKEKVLVIIGDALIPILKEVIQKTADWIKENEELIKQKVPEYIDKMATSIGKIIDIYNTIPSGVIGATGAGIIGAILFGSLGAGAIVGAIAYIITHLDDLRDSLNQIRGLEEQGLLLPLITTWDYLSEKGNEIIGVVQGIGVEAEKVSMKIIDTRDITDSWLEKIKAFPEATKEVTKGFEDLGKKGTKSIKDIIKDYGYLEGSTEKLVTAQLATYSEFYDAWRKKERSTSKDIIEYNKDRINKILKAEKANYKDLEDIQDSWLRKTKDAWEISAEDIKKSEKEVTEFIKEQYDERYAKGEWFFGGLEEWLWDNVRDWEGWGREIALSAYDMFDQIASDFESTVASGLKGEFDSIGDFWDAMLDNMLNAFADFVADLITKWALTELAGLFDIGISVSGGGGDSIATSILGKIASYVGEKTGLTSYLSGLFGTGGTTGAATTVYTAGPAVEGMYGIGGAAGTAGTASMGAWGGAGGYTGFAGGTYSAAAGGTAVGGGASAGLGAGGAIAGFAAMAIMAAINIEEMRKRRSALFDLKQQFDEYYATLESSEQAAATFSESQTNMFELVGDASAGYFVAQAVSLKASAGEYEELAKIHGESVEAVTARYENLGDAMKDFGYHVDEFGRVATSLGARELIQEMLWGTETAVSEANILKLTLEWDIGNLDEISAAALKTTKDLKTITEGPSATMDMDEYYDAAVASAERYIDDMKSKMQDLSTSEQDYITAMLEVWTDSTNARTAMSQTFFDSAEESYRALTEVEQAWVLTALSDYKSLTTEGTATAQAFYESQVNSYDMLTVAEQAWATSALGIITEYYDGATASSSSFLEKYRDDYETSTSIIEQYADNSLSTIQQVLGSIYPEMKKFYEEGTGYVESATTAAEDAINDLVATGIAAAGSASDSISSVAESMLESITKTGSSWDSLTNDIDSWNPKSKVIDIITQYTGGSALSAQHGAIISGPASGYTVPVTFHGTEEISSIGSNRDSGGNAGPIYITVEVGGQEFDARIASISDGVRVKAEKRSMGANRIYN